MKKIRIQDVLLPVVAACFCTAAFDGAIRVTAVLSKRGTPLAFHEAVFAALAHLPRLAIGAGVFAGVFLIIAGVSSRASHRRRDVWNVTSLAGSLAVSIALVVSSLHPIVKAFEF